MDGDDALAGLEEMIDQATQQIDVLMFTWEDDAVGRAIAERLARRAGPNLRVRVLIDGGGNLIFPENHERRTAADANGVLAILARNPHIELVRIRNPFARFDHRKLILIDGRLAWTGGRNLTKRAFFHQHDVTLRVAGPLAAALQRHFDESWQEQGGRTPSRVGGTVAAPGPVNARARLLETAPGRQQLARALYHAVDSARHHIYVENVFFCDNQLIARLAAARRRGVDVRVVLSFDSMTPAINRANRVVANRLLRAGIRVYLFPGMTHVKAMAVDGRWAYLGTANFDTLSFRHNRELGLAVSAGPVVRAVERRLFLPDFRPEWELRQPVPLRPGDSLYEALAGLFL